MQSVEVRGTSTFATKRKINRGVHQGADVYHAFLPVSTKKVLVGEKIERQRQILNLCENGETGLPALKRGYSEIKLKDL